jgi:hypothetical protein
MAHLDRCLSFYKVAAQITTVVAQAVLAGEWFRLRQNKVPLSNRTAADMTQEKTVGYLSQQLLLAFTVTENLEMKTILKFVVIVLCFSTMMWADLNEGFDSGVPAGWVINNQSTAGGLTSWFQGDDFVMPSHSGTNSYVAANFNNAPSGGAISDYLITPEVAFYSGAALSFWTRTADPGFGYQDRLEVLLSTNGSSTNIADFSSVLTVINLGLTPDGYPADWTQFVSDLSAFTGTGRIAFHYTVPNADNADYIGIDDVQVVPEPMSCILVGTGLAGMIARRRKLAKQ